MKIPLINNNIDIHNDNYYLISSNNNYIIPIINNNNNIQQVEEDGKFKYFLFKFIYLFYFNFIVQNRMEIHKK